MLKACVLALLFLACDVFRPVEAFMVPSIVLRPNMISKSAVLRYKSKLHDAKKEPTQGTEDLNETTEKYGLEVGLFKAMTSKEDDAADGSKKVKPQELLAKYGAAYLVTSITLAIISYGICYVLVSNGIDVGSLLEKLGIQATSTASNAGTAGIAYAIHKAASPIRFPPTVALTPVVAGWLGKKQNSQ